MIHQFDTEIATKYGINAAILLNNIVFWIAKNEANKENYYDGRYWTYNSVHAFNVLFPYLTARQIELAIKTLCDEGIILKGNYNKDKYDRTTWYALSGNVKCISPVREMDSTSTQNGFHADVKPIPDINQIINTDNIPPIVPQGDAEVKTNEASEDKPLLFDAPKSKNKPFTEGFDEFWTVYPRHQSKALAAKAWSKLHPDSELQSLIIVAVNKAKESPDWTKNNGTYIPYAATYLNQRRWEDEGPQPENNIRFLN